MSTRASQVEDFLPHHAPITLAGIGEALADLNPTEDWLGLSVPLPYTRREDGGPLAGTVDTIDVGPYNPDDDWMIYTARDYGGGAKNVTGIVARCPGYMVVLVVRALYAHLTAVGPQGCADTVEGDVLHALGLTRDPQAPSWP